MPTFAKGRLREEQGATWSRAGNGLPFADQESIGRDAQRGVVVKASPTSPFVVAKPDLLFQFVVITLFLSADIKSPTQ